MGGGCQHHAPAALPPGKTRYPLYRRLGRPQGRSGPVRKISPPLGFDPRTVQPVASRYTDCAIPAHTELNRDTNLTAKLRKQRKNGLNRILTDLRFLHGMVWLNTQVLGLLRCADCQLLTFRRSEVPASFRVKQTALRSIETEVIFQPVDTVGTSEDCTIQHHFCKNLKTWKILSLERRNRTETEMPHEYSHTINNLWIATIAKNCFYVVNR